jgi:enoyl-CoA hydratase/carnithine racemase
LDFPPVNAINPEFLSALEERLAAAIADESIAAVVLASALRVFSAGADARWMARLVRERGPEQFLAEFKATMDRFRALCLQMHRSDLVVIAALGGHTLAGGLEFAAACDLRFASDDDRIQIGVPEMKLFGELPSGGGGTQYLARLMGPTRCLHFILDGEPCSPRAALQLGIVDRLFEPSALLEQTVAWARRVAGQAGRIGLATAKRGIFDTATLTLDEAMAVDRQLHWDAMRRGRFLEGVNSFVQQYG